MKVVVSADGLTPDDFIHSGCDGALASSTRRWPTDYLMALNGLRQTAQADGDQRTVAVCLIMQAVLSSRTPWSQAPQPAEDDPVLPTYELDGSAFEYLGQILDLIADNETRARTADLLYQRSIGGRSKRDITAATTAVRAYLAEAARHEGTDHSGGHWPNTEKRVVERAFCIAAELRHTLLKREVVEHIERAIIAHMTNSSAGSAGNGQASTPSRYPVVLMTLLLRFKAGDSIRYGSLAERLAQEALAANQWEMGREYLDVAAEWHRQAGDPARELAAQEYAAESWVSEAESLVDRADTRDYWYLLAEYRLGCGIEAFRAVTGRAKECGFPKDEARLTARTEEVRRLHLQYQERGVGALVPIQVSETIDSGPIMALVEGKPKLEALFAMTTFRLETQAEVEQMVREEQKTHPLSSLFGLVQMDDRGHNTARTDSRVGEADLWARVCQRAVMLYEINAQIDVGPLIWRVGLDHAASIRQFAMIAQASPFVPSGSEPLFARGLNAGMQSDFDLAIHLLIPQVEHAVREIVRSAISNDEQMRETHWEMLADPDAPALGQALCHPSYAAELAQVLGEEAVFALRVILVERFGGNLRNRTLHGLVANGGTPNWLCWYFWWLVLKLCLATAVTANMKAED